MSDIKFYTYGGHAMPDLPVIPKEGDKLIVTHADGTETSYTFGVPVVRPDAGISQRMFLTGGNPPYEVIP
jgi:hypothetical protein